MTTNHTYKWYSLADDPELFLAQKTRGNKILVKFRDALPDERLEVKQYAGHIAVVRFRGFVDDMDMRWVCDLVNSWTPLRDEFFTHWTPLPD